MNKQAQHRDQPAWLSSRKRTAVSCFPRDTFQGNKHEELKIKFSFSRWSALTLSLLCVGQNGCAESMLVGMCMVSCRQAQTKTTRKEITGFCSEKGDSPWPRWSPLIRGVVHYQNCETCALQLHNRIHL